MTGGDCPGGYVRGGNALESHVAITDYTLAVVLSPVEEDEITIMYVSCTM